MNRLCFFLLVGLLSCFSNDTKNSISQINILTDNMDFEQQFQTFIELGYKLNDGISKEDITSVR